MKTMVELIRGSLGMRWTQITWALYEWFSSAKLVTLTLLVFIAVMMFASNPGFKRRMISLGFVMLGTYWFMVSPLFSIPATKLLVSFVPEDSGQKADAIVVLARNSDAQGDRYNTALNLVEQGRADRLLIMGRAQGVRTLRSLQERNLPPNMLLSAVCVHTTKQEAYSAAAILGPLNLNRIILITDAPHMLRAWLTFESLGFSTIPHIEPIADWVPHHERSFLAVREYLGLISYALLGRFKADPTTSLGQFAAAIAEDYPLERCFLTADQLGQAKSNS